MTGQGIVEQDRIEYDTMSNCEMTELKRDN